MVIEKLYPDRGNLAKSFGWLPVVLLLILVGSGLPCPKAAAQTEQKYEELPVNTGLKASTPSINKMLSQGRFDSGEQQVFDQFYQDFVLPQWTKVKDLANLPKERHDLANQLKKRSPGAPPTFTTI